MVGNLSNFHKLDVLRTLFSLEEAKSRSYLVSELEMGEGTIRTILDSLKSKKLIKSTPKGHIISKKGKELIDKIKEIITLPKEVKLEAFYKGTKKTAIKINISKKANYVKLRDIAVRNGAEGAMIFAFRNKLELPLHKGKFPGLENEFNFEKGDLLLLAFSKDKRWADIGSIAMAVEINTSLQSLVSDF